MRGRRDLPKEDLYEGVKSLVESEFQHIHLPQQKLYTLFSIAFQYLVFRSTKVPGAYIIRIEDSHLAEKLARKSKDASTRKFIQSLLLPRKLSYGKSIFYIDYFHVGTWNMTAEIPRDKIKGALICKNTSSKPMTEIDMDEEEEVEQNSMNPFPPNYYLDSLLEFVPKTITIALEQKFDQLNEIHFPFIKKEQEKVAGFTISSNINLDELED